jgi:branched-chain amino acid aminotransferase
LYLIVSGHILYYQLVRVDESWVPDEHGYSLYIRPTAIGTSPFLGVHASEEVKVYTILSPVGPYYSSKSKPVTLLADQDNVRAWPGGVGDVKVGGNYAPTIDVGAKAMEKGYSQVHIAHFLIPCGYPEYVCN